MNFRAENIPELQAYLEGYMAGLIERGYLKQSAGALGGCVSTYEGCRVLQGLYNLLLRSGYNIVRAPVVCHRNAHQARFVVFREF